MKNYRAQDGCRNCRFVLISFKEHSVTSICGKKKDDGPRLALSDRQVYREGICDDFEKAEKGNTDA